MNKIDELIYLINTTKIMEDIGLITYLERLRPYVKLAELISKSKGMLYSWDYTNDAPLLGNAASRLNKAYKLIKQIKEQENEN